MEPFTATAPEAPRSAATRRMHRWVNVRLAKQVAPTWGLDVVALAQEMCNEGRQDACEVLSREDDAKRAWLALQAEIAL
mgnify:CR=1 FL=1